MIKYRRGYDGVTHKFTFDSIERDIIKTGQFDDYLNSDYTLECERGHWSEGRGTRVKNRYDTIWKKNRNDCPDYLKVDYQRNLPVSRRVLEQQRENKKIWKNRAFVILFEIFLVILTVFLSVIFADQIESFFKNLF